MPPCQPGWFLTAVLPWAQEEADGHPVKQVEVDECPSTSKFGGTSNRTSSAVPSVFCSTSCSSLSRS